MSGPGTSTASRRVGVRLERRRQRRQVELREHDELDMGNHVAHARDALAQRAKGRLRVAEDRRRLERRDREQPHYAPIAAWNASVTSWPSFPPSTGSKLQLAV